MKRFIEIYKENDYKNKKSNFLVEFFNSILYEINPKGKIKRKLNEYDNETFFSVNLKQQIEDGVKLYLGLADDDIDD